jgi:glycosyltransferase involved in cell wall biosynthesis
MEILHLYKDYSPVLGGIENHVRLLAEAQAARGHRVTVLVASRGPRTHVENLGGVRVIFAARLATVASTPISVALALRLSAERPDIIHQHLPYPIGDAAQAVFGRARRRVVSYHSDIIRQRGLLRLYAPLLRRSLRRADAILATSPPYVASSPFLAPLAERCTVVPYGIDVARFERVEPSRVAAIRQRYGPRLILFVGQLRYYKGVDYLIRAMPHVVGRALLAGGESSQRQAELEALARSLGVGDRVAFLGQQDEALPALYHASDVLALPSIERSEAFAIVQLEAMAASRPVVSTDVGTGVAWVNQHEVTGLVVPPREPRALAMALDRVLNDPALAARLGSGGHRRVTENFTRALMLERIEQVYARVLAAPPRA